MKTNIKTTHINNNTNITKFAKIGEKRLETGANTINHLKSVGIYLYSYPKH